MKSLKSCFELIKRDGDNMFMPDVFGPGLSSRIALEEDFYRRKEYDATLLLDADQVHPRDMLEKFRTSMEKKNLDMVCALVYRRSVWPIEPMMFEMGDGTYPFRPVWDPPREGLHQIPMTGFGSVLIHRRVIEGVRKAIPKGASPFGVGPIPGITKDYGLFGQDYRFFMLAMKLGFKLWLQADVESKHGVTVWLGRETGDKLFDYDAWANKMHGIFVEERLRVHGMTPEAFKQRKRILEARKEGFLKQLNATDKDSRDELAQLSANLWIMEGKILEMNAWIEWAEKYPAVERPDQLPTTQNTTKMDDVAFDRPDAPREELYRTEAMDMVKQMPDVVGRVSPPDVGGNGSVTDS